ncbi:MAG TPA: hypothetical protein VHK28_10135 [Candidatus Limnocylindria bacterium]|nr:hypothetical protein [Candidatus Limnocylindria bacterium]
MHQRRGPATLRPGLARLALAVGLVAAATPGTVCRNGIRASHPRP